MSTPKMRGLKQILISLKLYNTNRFIDGKIVELAHQIGKHLQLRHNNNKQQYKQMVCNGCFNKLSLLYIFNKGRWGSNWEYRVGTKARNLKDADNNNIPHRLLRKWILQDDTDSYPLIHVCDVFQEKNLEDDYWSDLFDPQYNNEFIQLVRTGFNDNDINLQFMQESMEWNIQRIKGFQFNKHEHTFQISYPDKNNHGNQRCIVKMNSNHIMEFYDAIQVSYSGENANTMYLCFGKYTPIHDSDDKDNWCAPNYYSMDYVNGNEQKLGWNSMTNIIEPVYLIHECIQLTDDVRRQHDMPDDIKTMGLADWSRTLLHTNTEIHKLMEDEDFDESQFKWPCCAKWICKKHESSCMRCPKKNVNCKPNIGISNGNVILKINRTCTYLILKMDLQ